MISLKIPDRISTEAQIQVLSGKYRAWSHTTRSGQLFPPSSFSHLTQSRVKQSKLGSFRREVIPEVALVHDFAWSAGATTGAYPSCNNKVPATEATHLRNRGKPGLRWQEGWGKPSTGLRSTGLKRRREAGDTASGECRTPGRWGVSEKQGPATNLARKVLWVSERAVLEFGERCALVYEE